MVEEDLGVGIVPLQSAKEAVESGRLVAWWIEGAEIKWELGLARLSGGYESPVMQTFIRITRKHFEDNDGRNGLKKPAPRALKAKGGRKR